MPLHPAVPDLAALRHRIGAGFTVPIMAVEVVPYSSDWPAQFERAARTLGSALTCLRSATVEHVGSTSVPGLAAKPVLDIDIVVDSDDVTAAVSALKAIGYVHRGDLGVASWQS